MAAVATTLRSLTLTAIGSIAVLGAVLTMRAASSPGETSPAGGGRGDHAVARAAAPGAWEEGGRAAVGFHAGGDCPTPAPGAAPVRPAAPAGDVPAALWALLTLAVTPYGCPPAGS